MVIPGRGLFIPPKRPPKWDPSLFPGCHPWQGPFFHPKRPLNCTFGPTLGALWAVLRLLWLLWGDLGLPVVPLGRLGLPWDPGQHLDEQVGRISKACRQNIASWNLPGGPGGPGEVVSRSAVRSPTSTHAGGQDDMSFTNSLKPWCTLVYSVVYHGEPWYTIVY